MTVFSIGFTLFLIMNSLGVIPLVLAHLHTVEPPSKKYFVIFREMCIALVIVLIFCYFGAAFFKWLNIPNSSLQMAGGLILFLIAIRMIFPGPRVREEQAYQSKEIPFVTPIATPLVASPSLLAIVMFYARQEPSTLTLLYAILCAWAISTVILLFSPILRRAIGDRGLVAFQRLMGLILTLIAVQIFLQGLGSFITKNFQT